MRPGFPIEVGSEPDAIAFTPNGQTALVANLGSDNVTPVDLTHGHPGAAPTSRWSLSSSAG
jgi:DNA-binding beta-propeller fold protein YncE